MVILVDKDIEKMLEEDLVIEPLKDPEKQIQPASVDLRLGDHVVAISNGMKELKEKATKMKLEGKVVNPESMNIDPLDTRDPDDEAFVEMNIQGGYIDIPPTAFLLCTTVERVEIPDNLVARVEGKSTLARMGLSVHSTAGYIDPGFKGQVTLEVFNHSPRAVRLYVDDFVCQLVFEMASDSAERPYGCESRNSKYQNQKGATPGKKVVELNL